MTLTEVRAEKFKDKLCDYAISTMDNGNSTDTVQLSLTRKDILTIFNSFYDTYDNGNRDEKNNVRSIATKLHNMVNKRNSKM